MNNSINIIQKKIKLYYKTRSRKLPWRREGKINQNTTTTNTDTNNTASQTRM